MSGFARDSRLDVRYHACSRALGNLLQIKSSGPLSHILPKIWSEPAWSLLMNLPTKWSNELAVTGMYCVQKIIY